MSDNKKYYYLKLKENFFDRAEIKAIEKTQSGYEYICIIQKMYLRSLARCGKLMITDTVPFDLDTLSSVLDHKKESIAAAIALFKKYELCEILDDKTIYMTEIQNFIGESSTEADRKRIYREKIKDHKQITSGQMSDDRPPELELEKDIEIKKERKIKECNSENTSLHAFIKNYFGENNREYIHSAKEAKHIKIIEKRCGDHGFSRFLEIAQKFKQLEHEKWWEEQPFIPSTISSLWERIIKAKIKSSKKTQEEIDREDREAGYYNKNWQDEQD